jgi:hypothetical protein
MKMKVPEYQYTDNPHNTMGAVKIINGDFCGLAYQYGIVKFSEGKEDCSVNFTYEIIDNDKHFPENQEMKNAMGTILVDLLNRNYKDGYDNGTIDTKQLDS